MKNTPADKYATARRNQLDQAAWGDLQDEARIANELQQSHSLTRTEALRVAREIVQESRANAK